MPAHASDPWRGRRMFWVLFLYLGSSFFAGGHRKERNKKGGKEGGEERRKAGRKKPRTEGNKEQPLT